MSKTYAAALRALVNSPDGESHVADILNDELEYLLGLDVPLRAFGLPQLPRIALDSNDNYFCPVTVYINADSRSDATASIISDLNYLARLDDSPFLGFQFNPESDLKEVTHA